MKRVIAIGTELYLISDITGRILIPKKMLPDRTYYEYSMKMLDEKHILLTFDKTKEVKTCRMCIPSTIRYGMNIFGLESLFKLTTAENNEGFILELCEEAAWNELSEE